MEAHSEIHSLNNNRGINNILIDLLAAVSWTISIT